MKYVNMQEYKQTDEYRNLIKTMLAHLDSKRDKFHINGYKHYTFRQPPNGEYIMDAYDVPFFDRSTNFYYHNGGKLILNLPVYYYQLELFMKALFIRIFWAQGRNPDGYRYDGFAEFIWNEYCKSNDEHFIALKEEAFKIYNECNTVPEFYERFVLNDSYYFMSYENYIETMRATCAAYGYKLIGSDLVEFPEDSIEIFEGGQASKPERAARINNTADITQLRLISGHYNKLNTNTKYTFVPNNKAQALKSFNFSFLIIDGLFFPQLLVFPK